MNIYLQLTGAFNEDRLRAVICSGQAVVLHRLAIMSKDNEARLQAYGDAAASWASTWPQVATAMAGQPLTEAHRIMTAHAEGVLPHKVSVPGQADEIKGRNDV